MLVRHLGYRRHKLHCTFLNTNFHLHRTCRKTFIFSSSINKYCSRGTGEKIRSFSGDNFNFCLFILIYVDPILNNKIVKGILIHFIKKERLSDKINRSFDYLLGTVSKAITACCFFTSKDVSHVSNN